MTDLSDTSQKTPQFVTSGYIRSPRNDPAYRIQEVFKRKLYDGADWLTLIADV